MPNSIKKTRGVRRAGVTLLVVLVAAMGLTAWGYERYIDLVERQVEIADACARLEASNRSRLQLVSNLLHASTGEQARAVPLAALETAHELAAEPRIRPDMDPDDYDRFCLAQEDLSGALDAYWPVALADADRDSRATLGDLKSKLDRSSSVVQLRIDELDRCVDSYATQIRQFPGSLIAVISGTTEHVRVASGGGVSAEPAILND